MEKKIQRCPRCKGKKIIHYEEIIECSDCWLEFEKKDFNIMDEEDDIISISEKKRIVSLIKIPPK